MGLQGLMELFQFLLLSWELTQHPPNTHTHTITAPPVSTENFGHGPDTVFLLRIGKPTIHKARLWSFPTFLPTQKLL